MSFSRISTIHCRLNYSQILEIKLLFFNFVSKASRVVEAIKTEHVSLATFGDVSACLSLSEMLRIPLL